mgnify:CR=1 FL=1
MQVKIVRVYYDSDPDKAAKELEELINQGYIIKFATPLTDTSGCSVCYSYVEYLLIKLIDIREEITTPHN